MGGQEAGLEVGAREEIRQRLEREGVPPPVVEYVLKFSLIEFSESIINIVFALILFLSFKSSYLLLNFIENYTLPELYEVAIKMDGIIYIYNFIYPVIFFAPGIFFIYIALAVFVIFSSPKRQVPDFVKDITSPTPNRLWRWLLPRMIARLAHETDPARYVRRFVFMPAWFLLGAGALLFMMSVPLVIWQMGAFEVFTPRGYYVSPLLPWETPRLHPWASAISVETGCSHHSGKGGTSNSIIYRITFADGTVAEPADARSVRASWLDGMEIIDGTLHNRRARFTPWSLNDPYDPRCIRAMQRKFSADEFERLRRILRFPN